MVLRVMLNALNTGIIRASDFENQNLIESFKPLLTSRFRISIISKLISLLCESDQFRQQLS
jgi:hypothetical protein